MRNVNHVSVENLPAVGERLRAKIRYSAPLVPCLALPDEGEVRLQFARPQRAVAPGQAAVCYDGDAVALGGVIESAL